MLIDCHAHLASPDFDADRDEVRRRALSAAVELVLVVGEDAADNRRVEALARQELSDGARIGCCFGLHPDRFADDREPPDRAAIDEVIEQIRGAADSLVAIGEVGLDRWYVKDASRRTAQAALLEEMAALSNELGLPLNVHSRSAGGATVDLLRATGAERVLMHAFDGRAVHALRGVEAGFVFSIPPSAVRSPQKHKLIKRLPLDALALESDAPVLGPAKGERNEPANLRYTVELIAETHGVTPERVAEVTTANAQRLFGLRSPASGLQHARGKTED
jgi:TatD DNase family protein